VFYCRRPPSNAALCEDAKISVKSGGYILWCIHALTNLVIVAVFLVIQKCNDAEKMLKHVNVALHRFVFCKTHPLGRKCVIFGMTWQKGVIGTVDALIRVLLYCRTHCFRSKNMCCVILHTSMVPKWLFCAVHKAVHNHLPCTVCGKLSILTSWLLDTSSRICYTSYVDVSIRIFHPSWMPSLLHAIPLLWKRK
jgi:hypothetical protein